MDIGRQGSSRRCFSGGSSGWGRGVGWELTIADPLAPFLSSHVDSTLMGGLCLGREVEDRQRGASKWGSSSSRETVSPGVDEGNLMEYCQRRYRAKSIGRGDER